MIIVMFKVLGLKKRAVGVGESVRKARAKAARKLLSLMGGNRVLVVQELIYSAAGEVVHG